MSSGGIIEFTRVFMQRLSKPISLAIRNYTRSDLHYVSSKFPQVLNI